MDNSSVNDARNVAGPSPFTVVRLDEKRSGLRSPQNVAPPLRFNRPEKPWPIVSRLALRLPTGSSVQDLLGGAACLMIWGVLWFLTILTFAGGFEGHTRWLVRNRSMAQRPSSACRPRACLA